MPYFDFHLHPSLKSLFSDKSATTRKFHPWEKLRRSEIPFLLDLCTDFDYILASQANLAQLVVNECNLICNALYIPEKALIDNDLVASAAKSKLKNILQKGKVQQIIKSNPYELLLRDDWPTLTDAAQFGVTDRKVKPLKRREDYDESDLNTIHLVFTLEGFHTLSDGLRKYDKQVILQNLDDLRSRVSLISANLTHLEQAPFCNHAFGMPYLKEDIFKPTGKGISGDGFSIIRHCYENNILIDIKHMSLGARIDLYSFRNNEGAVYGHQPIVCTHAGFTGISINEIPDYLMSKLRYRKKYTMLQVGKPAPYGGSINRPSFNACSINLYDEDIQTILASGGLIGLSLDRRILGFQQYQPNAEIEFPLEVEYVSHDEEHLFLPHQPTVIGKAFERGRCITWDEVYEGSGRETSEGLQHLRHFMAHILHVIRLTGDNALAAMKQLCIGSDFDGLIDPIWCCETMDEIFHFQQQFEDSFEAFALESGVHLPDGFDIRKVSADIFFHNGKEFVLQRLDRLNGLT